MATIKLIGDAPNQVSRNKDLGELAYQDAENIAGDVGVGGNLSYTGTLTGGTGVINIGSGQVYKDASGNLGIGTSSPAYKLDVLGSVGISGSVLVDTGTASVPTIGFAGWVGTGIWNPTGTSLGFSTNNSEKMRIDASGHLIVPAGITLGTTTGTYNAANTLDDYEEGTWTPVIRGDGTAGTYELDADSQAHYIKIGRQVTLTVFIKLAAAITAGGTGDLNITGLPFSSTSLINNYPQGALLLSGVNFTSGGGLSVGFAGQIGAQSTLYFRTTTSNATPTFTPISAVSATDYIGFTFTYFA